MNLGRCQLGNWLCTTERLLIFGQNQRVAEYCLTDVVVNTFSNCYKTVFCIPGDGRDLIVVNRQSAIMVFEISAAVVVPQEIQCEFSAFAGYEDNHKHYRLLGQIPRTCEDNLITPGRAASLEFSMQFARRF